MAVEDGYAASRRRILQAGLLGAATLLLPPRTIARAAGGALRIGDAHVHLFNLADLPARGFIRHAFVSPDKADRGIFPAALDLIDRLRALPISAEDELSQLRQGKPYQTLPARRIYVEANRVIDLESRRSTIGNRGLIGLGRLWNRRLDLADSYGYLRALRTYLTRVAAKRGRTLEQLLGVAPEGGKDILFGGDRHPIRSKTADWLMRTFGGPGDGECRESPSDVSEISLDAIREQLLWVHLMVQPRRFLLERYLATIAKGSSRPVTLVNLLVDYDRWVADRPGQGSSHDSQITFWTAVARAKSGEGIDLRTFAGFDPLRHAEERTAAKYEAQRAGGPGKRAPGKPGYLDRLLGYFGTTDPARSIHGFKLYPPMGFAPSGNRPFQFESHDLAMEPIRARWAANFPDHDLHTELDSALDDFFRRCASTGIPILAHARHSNEAGRCFGARASPLGWEAVVTKYRKLRLCLGHFAETKDFVSGMERLEAGRPIHPRSWAVTATSRLLLMNRLPDPANVYADISYMSELLLPRKGLGARRARAFFLALKEYCRRFDPVCRHLMFGSDWIMLAREFRNEDYVAAIERGMDEAGWSDEWKDNLLHANLKRFLAA